MRSFLFVGPSTTAINSASLDLASKREAGSSPNATQDLKHQAGSLSRGGIQGTFTADE